MAKSARASSRKNNNQKLKRNVFGPVETARTERLSAKLMELVAQQLPAKETKKDEDAMEDDSEYRNHASDAVDPTENRSDGMLTCTAQEPTPSDQLNEEASAMQVDAERSSKKAANKKRIQKRRSKKSSIVFPKYKDRVTKRRK